MKKQLHFLLIAALFCMSNLTWAQENINQVFATFGDWLVDDKPNGTSSVSGGHLNVAMGDQGNGKYRADIKFQAGTNYTINKTSDQIIAIKFIGDRPATGTLKVELHNLTDNNWLNNGGGKYNPTGSVVTSAGNNIYYFDFSADANYSSGSIEVDRIGFTVADVVDPTNYTVDWIATFASVEDLEAYKNFADDGSGDSEGTLSLSKVDKFDGFKMYPNPSVNNELNIELGKLYTNKDVSINIYNTLGSLVYQKHVVSGVSKINFTHNLTSGIYLVQLEKQITKLVVK